MSKSAISKVDVYLPVRVSLICSGVSASEIYNAIENIQRLSGVLKVETWDSVEFFPVFDVKKYPEKFQEYDENPTGLPINYSYLKIGVLSEHNIHHVYNLDGSVVEGYPEEELLRMSKEGFADDVAKFIFDLVMTSNIADPGCLNTERGAIFLDGEYLKSISGIRSDLRSAIEAVGRYGWPIITPMNLSEVWEWINRIEGFSRGIGKSGVGRAVASFSYMFSSSNEESPFAEGLMAILGVESLYGESNVGLRSQLIEKTAAFLGGKPGQRKLVGKMYDYRSRFLHGDIDFPFYKSRYDALSEHERFYTDSLLPSHAAVVILLASLQELARKGLDRLEFKVVRA